MQNKTKQVPPYNSHDVEYFQSFRSEFILGIACYDSFESEVSLKENLLLSLQNGENLSEDVFEFFLLVLFLNNSHLQGKTHHLSNFYIITEKFLLKNFDRGIKFCQDLNFVKNLSLIEKEFLYFPLMVSEGVWNLVVIENIHKLIKPEILKRHKINYKRPSTLAKPQMIFFMFEKLQVQNKDTCKKIIENLENFLHYYMKIKYDEDNFDHKGFSINSFDLNYVKINLYDRLKDTGFIIGKLIDDCVTENSKNSTMKIQDLNEYVKNIGNQNFREHFTLQYSDALNEAKSAKQPRNTVSFKKSIKNGLLDVAILRKTNFIKFDSRKKMTKFVNDYIEEIKINKLEVKENIDEEDKISQDKEISAIYKSNHDTNFTNTESVEDSKPENKIKDNTSMLDTNDTFFQKSTDFGLNQIKTNNQRQNVVQKKDAPSLDEDEKDILVRHTVSASNSSKDIIKFCDNRLKNFNKQNYIKLDSACVDRNSIKKALVKAERDNDFETDLEDLRVEQQEYSTRSFNEKSHNKTKQAKHEITLKINELQKGENRIEQFNPPQSAVENKIIEPCSASDKFQKNENPTIFINSRNENQNQKVSDSGKLLYSNSMSVNDEKPLMARTGVTEKHQPESFPRTKSFYQTMISQIKCYEAEKIKVDNYATVNVNNFILEPKRKKESNQKAKKREELYIPNEMIKEDREENDFKPLCTCDPKCVIY